MIKKLDLKLVIVFSILSSSILIKALFNSQGYISPDSTNYLSLAQNLVDGKGFHLWNNYLAKENDLFAIWPIGYPLLIFIVSKVLGLSVFWASKILNILLIFMIFILFKKLFGDNAYFYGLTLFFSTFIEILSYTWSEVSFILGLLWFTFSIYYFNNDSTKNKNKWLFNILLSSVFIFLSRYIGLFIVGVIGCFSLYYLYRRNYKDFLKFIIVSIIVTSFALIYLFNNYFSTGYFTGMPRINSPETHYELTKMLFKAQLIEFNLLLPPIGNKYIFLLTSLILCVFILYFYLKVRMVKIDKINNFMWLYFYIIGAFYWLSIVCFRWNSHFDAFNYRLLGPSTFLFLIGTLAFFQFNYKIFLFKKLKNIIIFLAFLSFLINVPIEIIKNNIVNNQPIYTETYQSIINKYSEIPGKSIVVFGDKHLGYVRKNVNITSPFYIPYFNERETMEKFIKRIKQNTSWKIYIEVRNDLDPKKFDSSVIDFMEEHRDEKFILID